MNDEKEKTATTLTLGYYNGNKWPIHLIISELNVTLSLPAGKYVEDTLHRKINDSFFDKYTRPMQLTKEISKNGPVPLIAVPRVTSPTQNSGHQHSVRAVKDFTLDHNGQRQPVLSAPPAPPKLDVNTPSHKGMSVSEARRLGLIGKSREVPEDYGITDTAGSPVDINRAPPIRCSVESTPRIRQSEALPAELTAMSEKLDPALVPQRTQLLNSLTKSATVNVDSPVGFLHQTENAPQAQITESSEEQFPPVNLFANDSQPAPAAPPVMPAAPKTAKPFICTVDKADFKYRSQLESYAKRKYPDRLAEIMAPYPPA